MRALLVALTAAAAVLVNGAGTQPGAWREGKGGGSGQSDQAAGSQGRVGRELPCDDSVLEYISGSKVNAAIIPFSIDCILRYQELGHSLAVPPTVSVHLKGLGKTGTTWTEVILTTLLSKICEFGIYRGCSYQILEDSGMRRSVALLIPASAGGQSNAIIHFTVVNKHKPTYQAHCQALADPERRADCEGGFKNSMRNSLGHNFPTRGTDSSDWMDCAYRGPYSAMSECVPDYMRPAKLPWTVGAEVMNISEHHSFPIDRDSAQRKYIVTIRDPRDAALSRAHFTYAEGDNPSQYVMEAGCKEYVASSAFFYYWQVERHGARYPTFEMWYRETLDRPLRQVVRILQFLGLRATPRVVRQVVRATSFEALKAQEEKHELPGRNDPGTERAKIRKGRYGAFQEELSREAIELCTADMRRVLPVRMQLAFGV